MKKEYIVYKLSECAKHACRIDNELFTKFNVKRGLRNEDGTGVLVGLTKIGNVVGYERTDEGLKPFRENFSTGGTTWRTLPMPCCGRSVSVLRKWLICCFPVNCRMPNSSVRSRS